MNLNETYYQTLEQGLEALGQISDPYSKAMAAAALATAITSYNCEETQSVGAEPQSAGTESQAAPKRSRKKAEPAAVEPEVPAVVVAAPVEEPTPESVTAESQPVTEDAALPWTEADYKTFETQLALINGALAEHGEENMNAWVADFSSGVLSSIQDITPANIEAFYTYLTAN